MGRDSLHRKLRYTPGFGTLEPYFKLRQLHAIVWVYALRDATIADAPCIRPAGFNLAEYWQQSMAQFQANLPRYAVTVRIDPEVMLRLRYAGHFARIEQIDPPDADGWIPVSIRFDLEEEACAYVFAHGSGGAARTAR